VAFPAGSVSEETVVVITQEAQPYPRNCTGPLHTRYCQYPQFYHFNVFPDVRLNSPARVAACHINSGTERRPLPGSSHDFYRVAHDLPADAANWTPGAAQIDGIEILPYADAHDLVDCHNNSYLALTELRDSGLGGRALYALARIGSAVGRALTPKSAYAIDLGGGGELFMFSNVAVVDTFSTPDFAPGGTFQLSTTQPAPGGAVTIQPWTVENSGTAESNYSTIVVLATDSLLTTGAQNLTAAVASANALSPQQSGDAIAAQVVTIPPGLPNGTYFLGVRIIPGGPLPDGNPANNTVSAMIQVVAPVSSMTVTTAPSSTVRDRLLFPTQPAVRVLDPTGAPLPGTAVTVTLSGGGTLNGTTTATTNATGVATFTNLSIAGLAGARTLSFTTASPANASASITLTAGLPAAVSAGAGTNQSGVVGSLLPVAPAVTVSDADGNGVSGLVVVFTPTSAATVVTGSPVTTDASGAAAATSWTLGTQAGTSTVTATVYNDAGGAFHFTGSTGGTLTVASIAGNPVIFRSTGTAGSPVRVGFSTQPAVGQIFQAGVTLPVRAAIQDQFGNTVPTASGTITVAIGNNAGGGTLSGTATVSTTNGIATFSNLSIDKVGTGYTLSAAATGLTSGTSVPFTITFSTPTTLTMNGGNGQTATVGTTVPIAPSVKVTDAFGNGIPNIGVTFFVSGGGGSVTGPNPLTNAAGIATVGSWTLGTVAGPNTLTAIRGGLTGSPMIFSATGTP
jgi:hypothetical protein